MIAGNDLPDIMNTLVRQDIPLTPELFNAKAADLTPYLSGDAIKEYPNLAALPTRAWKGMVYDGKIWGVPTPTAQGQFFWWPLIHQELVDAAGHEPAQDDRRLQEAHGRTDEAAAEPVRHLSARAATSIRST